MKTFASVTLIFGLLSALEVSAAPQTYICSRTITEKKIVGLRPVFMKIPSEGTELEPLILKVDLDQSEVDGKPAQVSEGRIEVAQSQVKRKRGLLGSIIPELGEKKSVMTIDLTTGAYKKETSKVVIAIPYYNGVVPPTTEITLVTEGVCEKAVPL